MSGYRESNSGQMIGNHLCYLYTTPALCALYVWTTLPDRNHVFYGDWLTSDIGESNPCILHGKQAHYHCANIASNSVEACK